MRASSSGRAPSTKAASDGASARHCSLGPSLAFPRLPDIWNYASCETVAQRLMPLHALRRTSVTGGAHVRVAARRFMRTHVLARHRTGGESAAWLAPGFAARSRARYLISRPLPHVRTRGQRAAGARPVRARSAGAVSARWYRARWFAPQDPARRRIRYRAFRAARRSLHAWAGDQRTG